MTAANRKGLAIVIDGCDGAGKSAPLFTLRRLVERDGGLVFDLEEYWKEHKEHPIVRVIDHPQTSVEEQRRLVDSGEQGLLLPEFREYAAFLCCEPTYAGIGLDIRNRIINKHHHHFFSPRETAEFMANDRLAFIRLVRNPLREAGLMGFQGRSESTSAGYQPLQASIARKRAEQLGISYDPSTMDIGVEEVLNLTGNQYALAHLPDAYFFLTVGNADELIKRIDGRSKDDKAVFETLEFQVQANEIYTSEWFADIFRSRGASVHYVDAQGSVDKEESIRIAVAQTIENYHCVQRIASNTRERRVLARDITLEYLRTHD